MERVSLDMVNTKRYPDFGDLPRLSLPAFVVLGVRGAVRSDAIFTVFCIGAL